MAMTQWTPQGLLEYAPEQEPTWLDKQLIRMSNPANQALLALGASLTQGGSMAPISGGIYNAVQTYNKQKEHITDKAWQGRQRSMAEEEYPIELEGKQLNNNAHRNAATRFSWDAEERSRNEGAFSSMLPSAFAEMAEENPDLKPLIDYALQTKNSALATSILQHKNEKIPFEQGGKTYYLSPSQYKQLTKQDTSWSALEMAAAGGDPQAKKALESKTDRQIKVKGAGGSKASSSKKPEELYNAETDHTILVSPDDVTLKSMYLNAGYESKTTKSLKAQKQSSGSKLEELVSGKPQSAKSPATSPKKAFKSLPPASQFKGRTMNGGTIVSDGKNWIDKRTGKVIQ